MGFNDVTDPHPFIPGYIHVVLNITFGIHNHRLPGTRATDDIRIAAQSIHGYLLKIHFLPPKSLILFENFFLLSCIDFFIE